MANHVTGLELRSNEFAFRFVTNDGVDVELLAVFLQRAATVARRAGTELVVIGIADGSLIVKLRAVAKRAQKEFKKAPLASAAAAMGIMGGTAGIGTTVVAIVNAMSPASTKVSPIAKAGAILVEDHHVEKIEVITNNQTIVVMDEARAAQIEKLGAHRKLASEQLSAGPTIDRAEVLNVPRLVVAAQKGALSGEIFDVDGKLHFRPDGYRYLVPIDAGSGAFEELRPGLHVRVRGEIITQRGQPDRIFIGSAHPE